VRPNPGAINFASLSGRRIFAIWIFLIVHAYISVSSLVFLGFLYGFQRDPSNNFGCHSVYVHPYHEIRQVPSVPFLHVRPIESICVFSADYLKPTWHFVKSQRYISANLIDAPTFTDRI